MARADDYSRDDVDALREKMTRLFLVAAQRDGLEDVRAHNAPPEARAAAIIAWIHARRRAGEAPEANFEVVLERYREYYREIWRLYTHYVELVGTATYIRQSMQGRSQEEQAQYRQHVEWIVRLQTTAITIRFTIEVLESLVKLEAVLALEQTDLGQVVSPEQWFFEKDFLRTLKVADEERESKIVKDGGKKGQARWELVHHCLDYALRNSWCRVDNTVYVERKVKAANGRVYRTRSYEPVKWPDFDERTDKSTIEEFVVRACSRRTHEEMHDRLVAHGLTQSVVEIIKTSCVEDSRFPKLRLLRNILSFKNGVYDTAAGAYGIFYPYEHLQHCAVLQSETAAAAKYFEQAVDAEMCFASLGRGNDGWFDIPTPLFQSVLDYQNHGRVLDRKRGAPPPTAERPTKRAALEIFRHLKDFTESAEVACGNAEYAEDEAAACGELLNLQANGQRFAAKVQAVLGDYGIGAAVVVEEVRPPQALPPDLGGPPQDAAPPTATGHSLPEDAQRMIYVLVGRLLHDLGAFDAWQILLFIKGRAGTGKSLITTICSNFFELNQIGQIANNVEETFGVAQVANKFMWVCAEVKKNFKMDQSLFQQIVSGEPVSAAQKNRDAWTGPWKVPGIMAGNEWTGYQDAQGSIARRLVVVHFGHSVRKADSNPKLTEDILKQELATLIFKCNIAYRIAAATYDARDIWDVLPPYFAAQRRALQIETDPLIAVLNDETIFERNPASYMALKTLDTEYRQRWRQIRGNNYAENLSDDKLLSALHEVGATKVTEVRVDPVYGQDPRLDTWILGLRSVRDADAIAVAGPAGGAGRAATARP